MNTKRIVAGLFSFMILAASVVGTVVTIEDSKELDVRKSRIILPHKRK
tara:strand:+ start:9120 stop:9263 length:144 start_codon:yes stop_codon:yes gene_type:complete